MNTATTTILRYPYKILNVQKDEAGVWTAMILVDDDVHLASRKSGSWVILDGERRREALPHIAAALEKIVYPVELADLRARRKEAEAAKAVKKGDKKA